MAKENRGMPKLLATVRLPKVVNTSSKPVMVNTSSNPVMEFDGPVMDFGGFEMYTNIPDMILATPTVTEPFQTGLSDDYKFKSLLQKLSATTIKILHEEEIYDVEVFRIILQNALIWDFYGNLLLKIGVPGTELCIIRDSILYDH